MFTLLTDYQPHTRADRNADFDLCLQKNLENQFISSVEVLTDNPSVVPSHPKIKIAQVVRSRMTYGDLFAYAQLFCVDKLCILANRDVYFNETLEKALSWDYSKVILALSRDDQIARGNGSQDAWIFKAPLRNLHKAYTDFLLGLWGCDNRIAHELRVNAGYDLRNPARSIVLTHVHANDYRESERKKVDPPYGLVAVE